MRAFYCKVFAIIFASVECIKVTKKHIDLTRDYHCACILQFFFVCCSRNEQDNFMAFFQCCSASLFATTSLSFISFNLLALKYSLFLIPYSVGETGGIFATILCFFLRDG